MLLWIQCDQTKEYCIPHHPRREIPGSNLGLEVFGADYILPFLRFFARDVLGLAKD
jgi:hypothetical protein